MRAIALLLCFFLACPEAKVLTAKDYLAAFQKAGIPTESIEHYNSTTDPNNLLGRPDQYIGKSRWIDKRANAECTIELFRSATDLEARQQYIKRIIEGIGPLTEYQLIHRLALIRLDKALTPEQVEDYKRALAKLP